MSNIIKINKNPDHIKNIHRINRIDGQLKGVEKMIVEKEGHGFSEEKNRIEKLKRISAFFNKYLATY